MAVSLHKLLSLILLKSEVNCITVRPKAQINDRTAWVMADIFIQS